MKNNNGLFSKEWWRSLFVPVGGNEPKLLTFYKKDATKSVISSLLCILGGILIGFIFMLIMAAASDEITVADAFQGLGIIFQGPFASGSMYINTDFGNMLFKAVPIIMTGLSVAIAFKTGLFNIGASGQFLMAAMGAMLVALNIDCTGNPAAGFFVWLLAVLVGTAFAMIWGAIPGLFRALFNVNEVIVCIMTNWIAGNLVSWVFTNTPNLINTSSGKTNFLVTTSTTGTSTPTLGLDKIFKGSMLDMSIIIAIVLAVVVFIVLTRTTFGYELRACGANRYGAKYAGMSEKRNVILSMAIAGGLAGLGACFYYLNPGIEFNFKTTYQALPTEGFNGIPVALLASCNPIAVIFAGIFLKYISTGGSNLASAGFNQYLADIIIALIIYFAGFSKLIRDFLTKRQKKHSKKLEAKVLASIPPVEPKEENDTSPEEVEAAPPEGPPEEEAPIPDKQPEETQPELPKGDEEEKL